MDVETQLHAQMADFLPDPLPFVKAETIFPAQAARTTLAGRADLAPSEVGALMAWGAATRGVRAGRGFVNPCSSCYIISVLQVLVHTPPLHNYLLRQAPARADPLWAGLAATCRDAFAGGGGALSTQFVERRLRRLSPSLRRNEEGDAAEFLLCLLDRLHTALVGAGANKQSSVSAIFTTQLVSRVLCYNCMRPSDTPERFNMLPLEITPERSVAASVRLFFRTDVLDGENRYRCERCGTRAAASKAYRIAQPGWVLALQLKRFRWDGRKVNGHVAAPLQLDLREHGGAVYDLYGVVVHQGRSRASGHYYAYVKGPAGGWHVMNDESVRPTTAARVLKDDAYLLFYKRSDDTPPPAPARPTHGGLEPDAGVAVLAAPPSRRNPRVRTTITPLPGDEPPRKRRVAPPRIVARAEPQDAARPRADAAAFAPVPDGAQFAEDVGTWDGAEETRDAVRRAVAAEDRRLAARVRRLDAEDVEYDAPRPRKLRRDMKNAFRVRRGPNVFQQAADRARGRANGVD